MLMQFMKWADKHGYHQNTKFHKVEFNLRQVGKDDNIVFLTVEEVVRMNELKFRTDQTGLEQARDCYLFQCFTGLRYSDMKKVTRYNIKDDFLELVSQ